jgi:EAL domain-containing protein (putative c-di-GMP-specific phosphodiesterase class I)
VRLAHSTSLWARVPICNARGTGRDTGCAIGHYRTMPIADTADRRALTDRRSHGQDPIVRELLSALERGQIEILFQPQFAASDSRLVGAEALARWQHPGQFVIGGAMLFELAERAGLVEQLTHHIVRAALETAGNWPLPLRLSLNVTAADVAAGNFAENIAAAVAEAGFPPEHLTLEITEQVLVADLERTAERLGLLAGIGVRIALDDFGAGFCNFRYLKRLPLHAIKLDRSMIEGIVEDPRDLAVLRGILAMAGALGLEVIAEGVESEAQRDAIAREGCASWQGFLGAEPMAAGQFARLASV